MCTFQWSLFETRGEFYLVPNSMFSYCICFKTFCSVSKNGNSQFLQQLSNLTPNNVHIWIQSVWDTRRILLVPNSMFSHCLLKYILGCFIVIDYFLSWKKRKLDRAGYMTKLKSTDRSAKPITSELQTSFPLWESILLHASFAGLFLPL